MTPRVVSQSRSGTFLARMLHRVAIVQITPLRNCLFFFSFFLLEMQQLKLDTIFFVLSLTRYQSIRRTITNSDRTEESTADLLPEPEPDLIPHSISGRFEHTYGRLTFCVRPACLCLCSLVEYRRDGVVAHSNGRSRLSLLLQSPSAKFLCSPDFFTVLHSNPVSDLRCLATLLS